MHSTAVRLLQILVLLSLAACSSAPPKDGSEELAHTQCATCGAWNVPHDPLLIYGNTFYVGTKGLSAILITSPEGHVLIDGGLPESAPLIQANIEALGVDMNDISLILTSHPHVDHAGGLAALQQASGGI